MVSYSTVKKDVISSESKCSYKWPEGTICSLSEIFSAESMFWTEKTYSVTGVS